MRGRLHPAIGRARTEVNRTLEQRGILAPRAQPPTPEPPLVLVACSGGTDSLALAAVLDYFQRRKHGPRVQVGALVVDHQLQPGSAQVAARTARVLEDMGLSPVLVKAVTVDEHDGAGPEASARHARHQAFAQAAAETGAHAIVLAHTFDDQAEQVLLALARGSGTRSLAGIPEVTELALTSPVSPGTKDTPDPLAGELEEGVHTVPLLRPFLNITRRETEAICQFYQLDPWHDPTNADLRYTRSLVRHRVLPFLEEQLGPGVGKALHRTSAILAADAEFLDEYAAREFERIAHWDGEFLMLPESELNHAPVAIRTRMLALAVVAQGGENPSFERVKAAQTLLERHGSAGPVQLAGGVSVWRQVRDRPIDGRVPRGKRGPEYGNLIFVKSL